MKKQFLLGIFILLIMLSGCADNEWSIVSEKQNGVLTIKFLDKSVKTYNSIGRIYFHGESGGLYIFMFQDRDTENIRKLKIKRSHVLSIDIEYHDSI